LGSSAYFQIVGYRLKLGGSIPFSTRLYLGCLRQAEQKAHAEQAPWRKRVDGLPRSLVTDVANRGGLGGIESGAADPVHSAAGALNCGRLRSRGGLSWRNRRLPVPSFWIWVLAKVFALFFEEVAQVADQRIVAQYGAFLLRDVLNEPEHQHAHQGKSENCAYAVRQDAHDSRINASSIARVECRLLHRGNDWTWHPSSPKTSPAP